MRQAILIALFGVGGVASAEPIVPTYPGARAARIGDLAIDGRPHALGYFTTPDAPEDVARWYASRWEAEGYPTFVDGAAGECVVGAFATREGRILAVVLLRHGNQTLGFGAVKDVRRAFEAHGGPPPVALEGRVLSDVAMDGARHRAQLARGHFLLVRDAVGRRFAMRAGRLIAERTTEADGTRRIALEHEVGRHRVLTVLTEIDDAATAVHQTWMEQQSTGSGADR